MTDNNENQKDCKNNCPLQKDIGNWLTFLRLLRVHQTKDFATWKKIDELYEFLRGLNKD